MNHAESGGQSDVKIQPIVEGHGDVSAFPVLLRRLVQEAGIRAVDIARVRPCDWHSWSRTVAPC